MRNRWKGLGSNLYIFCLQCLIYRMTDSGAEHTSSFADRHQYRIFDILREVPLWKEILS